MIAVARFAVRRFLMATVFGGALLVPSVAAYADPLGLAQSGSGGLEVESDNGIEWRRNEQVLIARGNAVAKRGNSRVDADELRALYRDRDGQSEIRRSMTLTMPLSF
jgi:lipopolysaccharide export system protein LptA